MVVGNEIVIALYTRFKLCLIGNLLDSYNSVLINAAIDFVNQI